jgi:hypothetical protein
MELISSLQSLDGVSGSQKERLAQDYMLQAKEGLKAVNELNTELMGERLSQMYGIHTSQLTPVGDVVKVVDGDLRSDWATANEIMLVIQSPSNHYREELVEVQVPYYNFTLSEVRNNSQLTPVPYEKYLPRLWQNDNTTLVPSLAQFRVKFNPKELTKVFILKNEGTIRETNPAPDGVNASLIWNLNLPVFLPRYEGDIDNFQPNFRQLWPGNSIQAGTKTLTFVEIQKGAFNDTVAAQTGASSPIVPAPNENGTASNETTETGLMAETEGAFRSSGKPSKLDELIPQKYKIINTGNTTALLDPSNTTDPVNVGSAVFLYTDSATGVSQKFAFSLRYYIPATKADQPPETQQYGLMELERRKASGLYNLKVNSTKNDQQSYSYGKVNMKRSRLRQNDRSGEMLLLWEQ